MPRDSSVSKIPPTAPSPGGSAMTDRGLFERAAAHAGDFRESIAQRPAWPALQGATLRALFDGPTPELGQDGGEVIEALVSAAEPGLASSAGPRFFGWVIGSSDPVGVAADMLTSAWGQNAGNHACSPAAAVAEEVSARWLLDLLDLPPECSVGFTTGATMAGFVCLAAARNALLAKVGWDVELDGLIGAPQVRIFIGLDAHVTNISALRYLGLGGRPRWIATDKQGRMDAAALAEALAQGEGPALVIAQAGQLNTGAFDPFTDIVRLCRQHDAWLHVDGAFGLWARTVAELSHLTAGVEGADSWSVDGHKWLQLPYDSGFAIVRDSLAHRRAMAVAASYLPAAKTGEYDSGQYVPELSRRARGFAAWAVIRSLGRAGIAEMVARHCALARRLAARLAVEPGIKVLNEVDLNQVIVSFGGDAASREVIARMEEDNLCLVGGAVWRGAWVLRLSVIAGPLAEADIDRLADAVVSAWRHVRSTDNSNRGHKS
jgi:glutamate/tyrosine decarboxylase-like PLP-dependent enzyme